MSYIKRRKQEKKQRQMRIHDQLKKFETSKSCDALCHQKTGIVYECNDCGGKYHNKYMCQLFVITNKGWFLCQDCWNLNVLIISEEVFQV